MRFIKDNWTSILSVLFLIAIGVMLLVDPSTFAAGILRVAGILFAVLGIWDVIKYFRTAPEEAAKGSGFYSGALMITAGALCLFGRQWFEQVFPVLAVVYGAIQILLGYRKMQKAVDALRLKKQLWWMSAIGAGISLLFGFVIILNPEMTMMSIWVFTGIALIIEGLFDSAALIMLFRRKDTAK